MWGLPGRRRGGPAALWRWHEQLGSPPYSVEQTPRHATARKSLSATGGPAEATETKSQLHAELEMRAYNYNYINVVL